MTPVTDASTVTTREERHEHEPSGACLSLDTLLLPSSRSPEGESAYDFVSLVLKAAFPRVEHKPLVWRWRRTDVNRWTLQKLLAELAPDAEPASAWPLEESFLEPDQEFPVTLQFEPRKTFDFTFVIESCRRPEPNVVVS